MITAGVRFHAHRFRSLLVCRQLAGRGSTGMFFFCFPYLPRDNITSSHLVYPVFTVAGREIDGAGRLQGTHSCSLVDDTKDEGRQTASSSLDGHLHHYCIRVAPILFARVQGENNAGVTGAVPLSSFWIQTTACGWLACCGRRRRLAWVVPWFSIPPTILRDFL